MKDFIDGMMSSNHIVMQSLPHFSVPLFHLYPESRIRNLRIPRQCQILDRPALSGDFLMCSFEFVPAKACDVVFFFVQLV